MKTIAIGNFRLVPVRDGTYQGVRDHETIYSVWPYPGQKTWGASYHSSRRFVCKAKSLKVMAALLAARCGVSKGVDF